MKPWKTLATEGSWSLRERDGEFMVQRDARIVLKSRRRGDNDDLVRAAFARINTASPRILVGGLGFGGLTRAVLERLPDGGRMLIAEPMKPLVAWHQGPLAHFSGDALQDPRVELVVGELTSVLIKHRSAFDAVVLELDQGPFEVQLDDDASAFSVGGLSSLRASLRPGGRLAVSSEQPHPGFVKRLRQVGLEGAAEKTTSETFIFVGDAR